MSDTASTTAPPAPAQGTDADAAKPDTTDWQAEARKWEGRAKANIAAAQERDALKAEKAAEADRATAAERRAAEAEARATRREVALEHGLTKDDAAVLDSITDEDAMRAVAARLSTRQADRQQQDGNLVSREGTTPPPPPPSELKTFVSELFADKS